MEWFAVLVPILSIPIVRHYFPHRVVWWELLLPLLPTVVIIPLVIFGAELAQTADYERWGGWVTEIRYYEDWNEYVHRTCTRSCGKGCTTTYDCSYVQYHPEYWEAHTSNGEVVSMSKGEYRTILREKFGGRETFQELNRNSFTNDGDMYYARWPGTPETLQPVTTEHYYENRVQAASSVYQFPEVNPEDWDLFEYPDLDSPFWDESLLQQGAVSRNVVGDGNPRQRIQYLNATMGKQYEIRMWLLIFHNQPRAAGLAQESYWVGGNKNELVVCVGYDSNWNVDWCYPFCWSPDGYAGNDVLKANIRNFVEHDEAFDLSTGVEYIAQQVREHWKRKNFDEFSYLSVDTPTWAIILVWILTIGSTVGVCYFAVVNDIDEETWARRYPTRVERKFQEWWNRLVEAYWTAHNWVAEKLKRKPKNK